VRPIPFQFLVSGGFAIAFVLNALTGCGRPAIERVEWPVMGTVAAIQWRENGNVERETRNKEEIKLVFGKVEKLLNAHDPESELSRLAKLSDAEVIAKCDPLVRPCYETAFRLRDETGGRFNPRWRGTGTLDLGAIAKGFAVDLAGANVTNVLIDLGGNLKAIGGEWRVGILGGGEFTLAAGAACATSAKYYRGDHIKDGRGGGSVSNALVSVTVVHPTSAMLADGLSTTLFILGREAGERFLRTHYPEATACWR